MTVVGKIMVFFVLIFSLVQGAFAIMLFATGTKWPVAYAEQVKEGQVSRANSEQYKAEAG